LNVLEDIGWTKNQYTVKALPAETFIKATYRCCLKILMGALCLWFCSPGALQKINKAEKVSSFILTIS